MFACWAAALACGSSGSTSDGPGGSSGGTLDCAFVNGDNCWKTTEAAAAGCLPPASETGMLSADGTTCTYPSGAVVAFGSPLVIGPMASVNSFTLTTGGGLLCLQYEASTTGSSVTTSAGTVAFAVSPDHQSVSLTCPDGAVYAGGTASTVTACESSFPGLDQGEGFFGPSAVDGGHADGGYSGGYNVSIDGTGSAMAERVFNCATD